MENNELGYTLKLLAKVNRAIMYHGAVEFKPMRIQLRIKARALGGR